MKAKKIDFDRLMEMIHNDELAGFCIACGEETDGIEPDARNYHCDACNKPKVFGAPEILLMGLH
jgi:hypothetical protein